MQRTSQHEVTILWTVGGERLLASVSITDVVLEIAVASGSSDPQDVWTYGRDVLGVDPNGSWTYRRVLDEVVALTSERRLPA